jgi:hypothetical protein
MKAHRARTSSSSITREALQRLRAGDQSTIDEEGPSAGRPGAGALLDVLRHGGLVCAARETRLEGGHIELHVLRIGLELLRAGLRGVGEEHVVIGPDLPRLAGAAGRLMGLARSGMELVDGVIEDGCERPFAMADCTRAPIGALGVATGSVPHPHRQMALGRLMRKWSWWANKRHT